MANGIAALYQAEQHPIGRDRLAEFRSAAFYQAYEFIPDDALAIVLTIDELPMLVAVQQNRFYKLSFAPFDLSDSSQFPATVCEMLRIMPDAATLAVGTRYHVTASGTLARVTNWAFRLDDKNGLAFESKHSPESRETVEEEFAGALLAAMGWELPGPISPP
jgi:hypothetical protein